MEVRFCSKRELAIALGFSPHTIKTFRQKYWQEGVHFVRLNSRTIRYNKTLCIDWLATGNFPGLHPKRIENCLRELGQDRSC